MCHVGNDGGAKNTENSISAATAASRVFFFFTFSYGENKSNECCESWQVSQIYFGAVPPPTQYNIIRTRRTLARKFFSSYPFIFPFVSGQNNLQTRRNPIHGQSPFCERERGSKIYSLHF